MRVGDFIYATYKGHRIVGRIVYGFSPKMHEFTDQIGRTVDRKEVIGVALEQEQDTPVIRMEGGQWSFKPLENAIEIPPMPAQPEPAPEPVKKRKLFPRWIRPLRIRV